MNSDNKTIILTIVRHGQTDSNLTHMVQGFTDNPLNETGEKQAKAAGKALQDTLFHQAYSSDFKRANKTCRLILEANQKSNIAVENIKQERLLREKNFGISEGKSHKDFTEEDWKKTHESGESEEDVKNRAREFLKVLVKESDTHDQDIPSILIASHAGFIFRLFSIMFDEMKCCKTPPKLDVKRNKNTSFSKLKMEICTKNHVISEIECLDMYNSNHLENLE